MSAGKLAREKLRLDMEYQTAATNNMLPDIDSPTDAQRQEATNRALQQDTTSTAINALTKYIPKEAITLYIAAVSASSALQSIFPDLGVAVIYWAFAVLTPVLFLLIYMSHRASQGVRLLPQELEKWPWWEIFASTIAYLVWALAVPNNPYITTDAGAVLAGFGAVSISLMLNLLEPIANSLLGNSQAN